MSNHHDTAPGRVGAVTLDVAGVLVRPDHALVLPDARPDEQWDAVFYGVRVRQESRYDEVLWDAVAATVGTTVERVRHYLQRFHAVHASSTIWRAAPGAAAFLAELRVAGIPFAAISNTLRPMALEVLERAGLVGPEGIAADRVLDSSVIGVAKPDPRLFHAAFDMLGVPAAEVVHIGDSLDDDVEGAEGAGATGVHMQPLGTCGIAGHDDIVRFSDVDLMRGRER